MYFITATYRRISNHPLSEFAYAFDCKFFRLIDLTAKAFHTMTMNGFLVGATKPKIHTLKRVQLRSLGTFLCLLGSEGNASSQVPILSSLLWLVIAIAIVGKHTKIELEYLFLL